MWLFLVTINEWSTLLDIISLFCTATRMEVSTNKSCYMRNEVDDNTLAEIASIFPFKFDDLCCGIKYFGYHLKANNYKISYWLRLVSKIEKRIGSSSLGIFIWR